MDFPQPLGHFMKTLQQGRAHCGTNSNKYVATQVHEHRPYMWQSGWHLLLLDSVSFVSTRDTCGWGDSSEVKVLAT